MAVSEADRHELYSSLEDAIGKGPTETIMALLPPVGWADVATKHDLSQLEARLELRFEAMDARFSSVDGKLQAMDAKFDARLEAMESRISARVFRTALLVTIPTILATFALALTAVRLG